MKLFFTTTEDGVFQIGPTPSGRFAAAIERAAVLVVFVAIGGAIFFLPDYIGRYREQAPEPGFFGWLLLICAAFVALVAGVVRFLRKEVWVIDLDEQVFVYETSRIVGGFQQAAIDLDDVDRLVLREKGVPGESGIFVEIDDGAHTEALCRTRFSASSVRKVARDLREFIDEHNWDIDHSLETSGDRGSGK